MNMIVLVLWILAAVFAAIGAVTNPPRVNLVALGLACLAAGFVVEKAA